MNNMAIFASAAWTCDLVPRDRFTCQGGGQVHQGRFRLGAAGYDGHRTQLRIDTQARFPCANVGIYGQDGGVERGC